MALPAGFQFPPLGDTGEGDPPYPGRKGAIWQSGPYGVSHQGDRPACAFRCHYPGGASPCDLVTALAFVEAATMEVYVEAIAR